MVKIFNFWWGSWINNTNLVKLDDINCEYTPNGQCKVSEFITTNGFWDAKKN